jgi:hypothetical protein
MRLAHIILAHKNPAQVARLAKQLSHPDVDCWIHIDRKCDITDLGVIARMQNVYLIEPRIEVSWACFNLVQAMLNGMRAVLNSCGEYDYVNFLSGQDYPLQPPDRLLDYLCDHNGYEFIGNRPYEESEQNVRRMHRYHFTGAGFPGRRLLQRAVNALLPDRIFPYDFKVRKGPQWMTLTTAAVLYILEFVSENPRYGRYFKWVHAPDEFFFQTILYNSPFRDRMRNQIFHHIDWSEGKKNPKTFTIDDRECLMASGQLFARKFDMSVDFQILDLLDKRIIKNEKLKQC